MAAQPTLLATRWHPHEIRDLEPTLASSCLAGFVAAIDQPGPLARLRYLRALEGAPSRNGRAAQVESLAQQATGGYPELRAAWAQQRGAHLPPKYLELIDPGRVFTRLRDRVAEAVHRIAARHEGELVVMVAHGGVLDALYRLATGQAVDAPRTWELPNAAINRLLWTPDSLTVVGWSDTSHLARSALDEQTA